MCLRKSHSLTTKKDKMPGRLVSLGLAFGVLFLLSILSPWEAYTDVIVVQHEFPRPAPAPETPSPGPQALDIPKSPSLTYRTPNSSNQAQEPFGMFMDKNRQGLGLQWEPGGKIPGVDLGVESHNFQSLNRIFPKNEGNLNWTPDSDAQYYGNPRTAPDHNGAFLRFRW